jgi:class 3 adenylate cyclase
MIPASHGRFIAEQVPHARFIELPGADGLPLWETTDEILAHVEEFLTGSRPGGGPERVLTTLLFTDIVDSTRHAARLGDAAWRQLLDRHDRVLRDRIDLHRGRVVDSAGDGTLATFSSPDAAIECALGLPGALRELGVKLRTGLHAGTVELRENGRLGGIAVHIGARLMSLAEPDEVLVSHTLQGILIGSRHSFDERGVHELKGVPGRWPLYSVKAGSRAP